MDVYLQMRDVQWSTITDLQKQSLFLMRGVSKSG